MLIPTPPHSDRDYRVEDYFHPSVGCIWETRNLELWERLGDGFLYFRSLNSIKPVAHRQTLFHGLLQCSMDDGVYIRNRLLGYDGFLFEFYIGQLISPTRFS